MKNYAQVLLELKKEIEDGILSYDSMIQVNFSVTPCIWYYSDATMQRDFLSAKKDLDENGLDFILFEKIQAIYEKYLETRDSLSIISVADAISFLENKTNSHSH